MRWTSPGSACWCSFVFVVMAMSNGVNLTDGLDGLATGASVMVLGAYALMAFWQYRHWCDDPSYLGTTAITVRDPLEIAIDGRRRRRRPVSASCGGTPRRPGSSWATPVRWAWVA